MYVTYQNRLLAASKTEEFVLLVEEAKIVKADLEQLLEHLLHISGSVVEQMVSEKERQECSGTAMDAREEVSASAPASLLAVTDGPALQAEPVPVRAEKEKGPSAREDAVKTSPDLQGFQVSVHKLYKKGLTPREIAQKLDKGQEEVKLIINLMEMQYMNI